MPHSDVGWIYALEQWIIAYGQTDQQEEGAKVCIFGSFFAGLCLCRIFGDGASRQAGSVEDTGDAAHNLLAER